jgi:hypothetical protein
MFSQKVLTFGASGRTAPTPTIAMARYEVFSMMAPLQELGRKEEKGKAGL